MRKITFFAFLIFLGACSKKEDIETGIKSDTSGMTSYYPLNSDATDEGPNGFNGTIEGTIPAMDRKGDAKGAVYFNGAGDYIKLNKALKISDVQTIAFWVKFKTLKEGMEGMELVSKSSQRKGIEVLIHQDKLKFFIMGDDKSNYVGIPIQELKVNDWYFVTAVYNQKEAEMKIYLNGELKASSWAPTRAIEVDNLLLGTWNYETTPRFFNGYLDDVKLYNRPLTETEIADLFKMD